MSYIVSLHILKYILFSGLKTCMDFTFTFLYWHAYWLNVDVLPIWTKVGTIGMNELWWFLAFIEPCWLDNEIWDHSSDKWARICNSCDRVRISTRTYSGVHALTQRQTTTQTSGKEKGILLSPMVAPSSVYSNQFMSYERGCGKMVCVCMSLYLCVSFYNSVWFRL